MRLAGVLRTSTPLRLTALLILIFTVSSFATFGAAYLVVRDNFDAILREQVRQTMATYQSVADADDLRERLAAEAATIDPKVLVLDYRPDAGGRIGNTAGIPPVAGFTVLPETAIREDGDLGDSYLALSARVAGGTLTVAQTREQVIEMGEIFSTVLAVSLLPTLAIAVFVGLVIATQARRKIEGIGRVLASLTTGTLSARVPVAAGDADDLSQIGVAVNRMAAAQEASTEALRQVSADIAHDLKTPIQRVAVLLERLSAGPSLTPEQDEIVARARGETRAIVRTFQSLLQIAQLEGGSVRERFGRLDLGALAAKLVDVYAPSAEETGHALVLRRDDGPLEVAGDPDLLGQVIANLIENGLRHTPPGSRIAVAAGRKSGRVILSVGDDGPGIPAQERGNVLRRLYRLERSRTSEGSGLGLSLVAAIADLHGAELALSDGEPGLVVALLFPGAAIIPAG